MQLFAFGEKVDVTVKARLQAINGTQYAGYSFSFFTHRQYTMDEQEQMQAAIQKMQAAEASPGVNNVIQSNAPAASAYQILVNTNPTAGQVFFSNRGFTDQSLWIVENNGDSVFKRSHQVSALTGS